MKLYNVAYSGNSYKVRLLLAQLGIPYEIIEVDILKGESRTAEFLKINPNGRTPVLDDKGFVLAESNAILAYLAKGTKFLPDDRQKFGLIFQWMCFEQYSHEPFIATSRFWLQHKPDSPEKTALLASKRDGGWAALQDHGRSSGKERFLRRRLQHRRHRPLCLHPRRGGRRFSAGRFSEDQSVD